MGSDCFSIAYKFKDNAYQSCHEIDLTICEHIYQILYEFLKDTLTRKAEADYLEDVDACMDVLYEYYIEKNELDFCRRDSCPVALDRCFSLV